MEDQKSSMLEVLSFNKGFAHPEQWLEYGLAHHFKKTKAEKLVACPDCGAQRFKSMGQFVYYSTLVQLVECRSCGLFFTDTRIDPAVISEHFERSYKDETYFVKQRYRIFQQMTELVGKIAPQGGKVLDIGGAKGHLLATLQSHRPDLTLVLNDLSNASCEHARAYYGFQTVCGGIEQLEGHSSHCYDVIILSDVIYYEPELRRLWAVLPRLLAEHGTVLIRVPNKIGLIRAWQIWCRVTKGASSLTMQDKIRFFNPEHLFVFTRPYLLRRLQSMGFQYVYAEPSELLGKGGGDWKGRFFFYLSKAIAFVSARRLIVTPSQLIIATSKSSKP